MEKIYEEGNNNTKKKSVINLSVVLSFVIAVCAMFSLIAFGFNQVSYAVPDTAPDSFTVYRKVTDGSTFPVAINSFSSDKEIESTRFEVPLYYTDQAFTDLVFCIEKNHFVDNKDIYNKLEEINDTGLLYLLSNSYVNGKNVEEIGSSCFNGCILLKDFDFGNSIKYIRADALRNTAIESLTIPESCIEIEGEAFSDCENLKIFTAEGEFTSGLSIFKNLITLKLWHSHHLTLD